MRCCAPTRSSTAPALYLRAERSDFLRFNHAALRQATTVVHQARRTLAVERGRRRAESTLSLSRRCRPSTCRACRPSARCWPRSST